MDGLCLGLRPFGGYKGFGEIYLTSQIEIREINHTGGEKQQRCNLGPQSQRPFVQHRKGGSVWQSYGLARQKKCWLQGVQLSYINLKVGKLHCKHNKDKLHAYIFMLKPYRYLGKHFMLLKCPTVMRLLGEREGGNAYIDISLEKRGKKHTGHVRHFFTMAKRERGKSADVFQTERRRKGI